MIYISYIILLLVAVAYVSNAADPTGSTPKPLGATTSGSGDKSADEFPMAEFTFQFLSKPDAYSDKVMTASTGKPYFCLTSIVSPVQFSHKTEIMSMAVVGCRTATTRRLGLCYSDECDTKERKSYIVTYDMKSSSITDIATSDDKVVNTSIWNMNSTKFFDDSVVNEINGQAGKYFCRIDSSLTPYYINDDDTSYSYLISKGCVVGKATVNADCKCDNASPYRVSINNKRQITEVKSLAMEDPKTPTGKADKKAFDIFKATLGSNTAYASLPAKSWANFWFVCYIAYDKSHLAAAGSEANAINGQYVFEGCRYNGTPSPNGLCISSCKTPERMTVMLVYDDTKQSDTSITAGVITDLFIGEKDMFASPKKTLRH